ncbi:hypothetical protein A2U01_0022780, partial [Trifolium medium]|nr:hypothetical protein [Trifolium medium]
MASFGERMLKLAADNKKTGKKKIKGGTVVSLSQSAPGNSSSPGGGHACSSAPKETPQKRQRQDDSVVVLTASEPQFVLPNCFGARGFLERFHPAVADSEKSIILGMTPTAQETQLVQDTAAVMRLLETALVLNSEETCPVAELKKLQAKNEKLRVEVTKVENAFSDYREKHEIQVGLVSERGAKTAEIARLTEERKKLQEELGTLQLSMTPDEDEPEAARGLSTRAELIEKIWVLGQDVLDGVKFGFDNAVDQLKVLNPRLELNTELLSMLKRVENGQLVIPPEYVEMEEEDEDDQDDGEKGQEEEGEKGQEDEDDQD